MARYMTNPLRYTEYYPLAGMLFRDKVLLYQHDLAAETMTDNKDMLRWNAAMGYNLSGDLYTGVNNPWLAVIGGAAVRYVRLVVDGNTAWPAAQISALEVYGE